jgi:transposase-like protein
VQRLCANSKAPWEVSVELKPKWSGWLAVDGDSLAVGAHRESMLLGVDLEVLDIPHMILAEEENGENWLFYFLVLKHIGYPFLGVVSDGEPAIEAAVSLVCPGLPHQLCVKHFQDGLHRYLRYDFDYRHGNRKEIERFEDLVRECLYASTLARAEERLAVVRSDWAFKRAHLHSAVAILEQNWNRLTQHFHHPGLMRTSNAAEGVIRKLDRRIDAMDSFAGHNTAWNVLKMLVMHTRFRVLTDCRGPNNHRNGFSPLQLAGIDMQHVNWIRFSQKATS